MGSTKPVSGLRAALERKSCFDLKAMILFFFLPTDLVKLPTAQGYFNLYW